MSSSVRGSGEDAFSLAVGAAVRYNSVDNLENHEPAPGGSHFIAMSDSKAEVNDKHLSRAVHSHGGSDGRGSTALGHGAAMDDIGLELESIHPHSQPLSTSTKSERKSRAQDDVAPYHRADGRRGDDHTSADDDSDDGVRMGGMLVDDDGGTDPDLAASAAYGDHGNGCCKVIPGPPHVKNIIVCELCERFCYYGLRAILVLYLKDRLKYSEHTAVAIYSYFASAAYFSTLIGGYVSDAHWAKYKTIFWFVLIYLTGSLCLAVTSIWKIPAGAFVGLFLIALGTGGIKPCVSAFGGDQFPCTATTAVAGYFMAFYFSINVGSFSTYVLTPLVRHYAGFSAAFGLSSFLLFCSFLVFWSARKKYIVTPATGSVLAQLFNVVKAARSSKPLRSDQSSAGGFVGGGTATASPVSASHESHWLDRARGQFSAQVVEDTKAVWHILPLFCMFPVWWALFDQQGSTWTLQAKEMDLMGFQPDQLGVLNAVFVVIFIPLFDKVLLPFFRRLPCSALYPTPLRRMGVGMFIASGSFVVAAMVEAKINNSPDKSVSILWQLPQYIIITFGEICTSVTGLEFAYSEAPASMKGLVMAFYLAGNGVGDLLTGVLYNVIGARLSRVNMFLVFAALMFLNAVGFVFLAVRYTPRKPVVSLASSDEVGSSTPSIVLREEGMQVVSLPERARRSHPPLSATA